MGACGYTVRRCGNGSRPAVGRVCGDAQVCLEGDEGTEPWVLQHSSDGELWEDLLFLDSKGGSEQSAADVGWAAIPGPGPKLTLFRAVQLEGEDPAYREFSPLARDGESLVLTGTATSSAGAWSFFSWRGILTVADGEVTSFEKIMSFPEEIEPLDLLTIDGWFDKVPGFQAQGAEVIDVSWHKELGYPVSGFIDISTLIADEEQSWTIGSLSPL